MAKIFAADTVSVPAHFSDAIDHLVFIPPPTYHAGPHPDAHAIISANDWNNGEFRDQLNPQTLTYTTLPEMFARDLEMPRPQEYASPDGSVFLRAVRTLVQGPADYTGWRFSDNLDTHGFLNPAVGSRVYVASSSEDRTYSAKVNPDGTLSDLRPFAERGGESVAVDARGTVYIANGQIFVYDPTGKQIGEIDVPEQPLQLIFGGADHRTLFILAHHTLYSVAVR